jgi:RNA ligase
VSDLTRDLGKLNSLTKYPSIPTYHGMDKGRLTDEVVDLGDEEVYVSEKVDGTNARIILLPNGDYILGSREELLYAKGDRIKSPTLSVVETLFDLAESGWLVRENDLTVVFGEVYGRGINSKAYSTTQTGFRVFDVMHMGFVEAMIVLEMDREEISRWRKQGDQKFLDVSDLVSWCDESNVTLTPRLMSLYPRDIPTTHAGVLDLLHDILPNSRATLDTSGSGRAEGIVVRTWDRKTIVKIRFEDYEKTLRK